MLCGDEGMREQRRRMRRVRTVGIFGEPMRIFILCKREKKKEAIRITIGRRRRRGIRHFGGDLLGLLTMKALSHKSLMKTLYLCEVKRV